ncbi:MAG TPA: hypothetical protein VFQ61_29300 [Polyangiaceae bacterium]|nr:hypothetical protein [Polyangiaceae bacterium]
MASAKAVRGMVLVGGVTYRIVRLAAGSYSVIRILDDVEVGRFECAPKLRVERTCIDPVEFLVIAREAIQTAKTSWVGRAVVDPVAAERRFELPSRPAN